MHGNWKEINKELYMTAEAQIAASNNARQNMTRHESSEQTQQKQNGKQNEQTRLKIITVRISTDKNHLMRHKQKQTQQQKT